MERAEEEEETLKWDSHLNLSLSAAERLEVLNEGEEDLVLVLAA